MKWKYVGPGLLVSLVTLLLLLGGLLLVDLHYHQKYLNLAGLNYRGYRGPVLGKKQPNEIRIAMCGGSTTLGYGVRYDQAVPYQLQNKLQALCDAAHCGKKITVINLGYNNAGSYAFAFDLADFAYLDYDAAILYEGYNDIGLGNVTVGRHFDPIFRAFHYLPILPLIASEKLKVIKSRGDLDGAYRGKKFTFKPTAREHIQIAALNNLLQTFNGMNGAVNRVLDEAKASGFDKEQLKTDKWAWYKHFEELAIDYGLTNHKKVVVMTQPYISPAHREQQAELRAMLAARYGKNDQVLYVNLGEAISLRNRRLAYDGMHLTALGGDVISTIVAEKVKGFLL
jgi:hypothetical protein